MIQDWTVAGPRLRQELKEEIGFQVTDFAARRLGVLETTEERRDKAVLRLLTPRYHISSPGSGARRARVFSTFSRNSAKEFALSIKEFGVKAGLKGYSGYAFNWAIQWSLFSLRRSGIVRAGTFSSNVSRISKMNEGSPWMFHSCWSCLLGWPWWRNWNQELFWVE